MDYSFKDIYSPAKSVVETDSYVIYGRTSAYGHQKRQAIIDDRVFYFNDLVGQDLHVLKALIFDGSCIQLNDKYVTPREIIDYISAEKSSLSPEDQQLMTVSIKADKTTKMSVINEVKQALRQAKALKINYSAIETKH